MERGEEAELQVGLSVDPRLPRDAGEDGKVEPVVRHGPLEEATFVVEDVQPSELDQRGGPVLDDPRHHLAWKPPLEPRGGDPGVRLDCARRA